MGVAAHPQAAALSRSSRRAAPLRRWTRREPSQRGECRAEGGSGAPTGSGFVKIFSTCCAFAALDSSGAITAWGDSSNGGSGAPTGSGFVKIFSTGYAFAALDSSGAITAWGDSTGGGSGAPTGSGFVKIFSTGYAFAALDSSGIPLGVAAAWGSGFVDLLGYAFAALDSSGPSQRGDLRRAAALSRSSRLATPLRRWTRREPSQRGEIRLGG